MAAAGRGGHSFFEMHLVTALQGGYSLRLFESYTRKLARRCFAKDTPRPTRALRNALPKSVSQRSQSLQQ